jgi:hypothetical protein
MDKYVPKELPMEVFNEIGKTGFSKHGDYIYNGDQQQVKKNIPSNMLIISNKSLKIVRKNAIMQDEQTIKCEYGYKGRYQIVKSEYVFQIFTKRSSLEIQQLTGELESDLLKNAQYLNNLIQQLSELKLGNSVIPQKQEPQEKEKEKKSEIPQTPANSSFAPPPPPPFLPSLILSSGAPESSKAKQVREKNKDEQLTKQPNEMTGLNDSKSQLFAAIKKRGEDLEKSQTTPISTPLLESSKDQMQESKQPLIKEIEGVSNPTSAEEQSFLKIKMLWGKIPEERRQEISTFYANDPIIKSMLEVAVGRLPMFSDKRMVGHFSPGSVDKLLKSINKRAKFITPEEMPSLPEMYQAVTYTLLNMRLGSLRSEDAKKLIVSLRNPS